MENNFEQENQNNGQVYEQNNQSYPQNNEQFYEQNNQNYYQNNGQYYSQNNGQDYNGYPVNNIPNQVPDESKTGIGILCGFIGLIGLVIGLCSYKEGTYARKTFMKAWGITFGVTTGISVLCSFLSTFLLLLI